MLDLQKANVYFPTWTQVLKVLRSLWFELQVNVYMENLQVILMGHCKVVLFYSSAWHWKAQCIHGLEDKNMTALPTPLKIAHFWNSNLRFVIHCFHRNLCKFWYSQKIIFYGTVFDTALWHAIMWWSVHRRHAVPLRRAVLWWRLLKKSTVRACRLALHKQLRLSPAAHGQRVKYVVPVGTQSRLQSHHTIFLFTLSWSSDLFFSNQGNHVIFIRPMQMLYFESTWSLVAGMIRSLVC